MARIGFASKTGFAALALALLSGSAWAAASCARPQDVTALRTAALQQHLMVAALTCHDTAAYNRFVTSHQSELRDSDKALMDYFHRHDGRNGDDAYNAYKTVLANDSSLLSLHDSRFCAEANAAFDRTLDREKPLAELVSSLPSAVKIGYVSCVPDAPVTLTARRHDVPDSSSSASIDDRNAPRGYAEDARDAGRRQPRDSYRRDTYAGDADRRDGTEARDDAYEASPRTRGYAEDTRNAEDARDAGRRQQRDSYERDAYAGDADRRYGTEARDYDRSDNRYNDNAGDDSEDGYSDDPQPFYGQR